jgi:ketopantoate hydroxymethyltransferase
VTTTIAAAPGTPCDGQILVVDGAAGTVGIEP